MQESNPSAPKREPVTTCCFCTEAHSGRFSEDLSQVYDVESRISYETEDLVVVPSVSPLAPGHVLILPRAHVTRLSDLPDSLAWQLSDCIGTVRYRLSRRFGPTHYFMEHGVPTGQVACGVDHAHLHIIPLPSETITAVELEVERDFPRHAHGALSEVLKIASFRIGKSYVLHGPGMDSLAIGFADQIPSQYMRRLIARARRNSEWDWKLLYGRADFLATLEVCARD
jgi:diadenosine tetraphosphate (Ap4A) HIT family hydrolase